MFLRKKNKSDLQDAQTHPPQNKKTKHAWPTGIMKFSVSVLSDTLMVDAPP
jgi:hypothetical protein